MEDKELSGEESLALISRMISQAKSSIAQSHSFYLIMWGWVVAVANIGHYVIAKWDLYDYPSVVWLLIIPAIIGTIRKNRQLRKSSSVRGHYNRLYVSVWAVVSICIFIVLICMDKLNYNHNPIILLFSGIGTFLSGQILKFNPLKYGSFELFTAGTIGLLLPVTEQYLVAGIAIIAGYLVPGYLLLKEEKRV